MKNQPSIEQSVLNRIKDEHICPTGRWHFRFINCCYWTTFSTFLVLATAAIGTVLFILIETKESLLATEGLNESSLLGSLPVAWTILLLASVLLGYKAFTRTQSGYRQQALLAACATGSVLCGVLLYSANGAEHIDRFALQTIPYYKQAVVSKTTAWSQADKGYLAGTVEAVYGPGDFTLRAFDGTSYRIRSATDENSPTLTTGREIKIRGALANTSARLRAPVAAPMAASFAKEAPPEDLFMATADSAIEATSLAQEEVPEIGFAVEATAETFPEDEALEFEAFTIEQW